MRQRGRNSKVDDRTRLNQLPPAKVARMRDPHALPEHLFYNIL